MLARIYQPARNAMQSGVGRTKVWILEFAPEEAKKKDPLMGWTGSGDMLGQVRLNFDSKDEAIAYAEHYNIAYVVEEPKPRKANVRPGGYGENFSSNRRAPWTH